MTETEAMKKAEELLRDTIIAGAVQVRQRIAAALLSVDEAAEKRGYAQGRTDAGMSEPPCPECQMDTRFHTADCKYHQTAYERGYNEGYAKGVEVVAKLADNITYNHLSSGARLAASDTAVQIAETIHALLAEPVGERLEVSILDTVLTFDVTKTHSYEHAEDCAFESATDYRRAMSYTSELYRALVASPITRGDEKEGER